jgi:hypothetical protein
MFAAFALLATACCQVPGLGGGGGGGGGASAKGATPAATTTAPAAPGTERTAVPTSAEWAQSARLTTNGDDSCEAKKVREWIQVYCRHCADDKKKPGAICSDKYDFGDPQMARGAKTGEISFYSKKNADKSSISAAVFPVRIGTDVAIRMPGVNGPASTFGGVWRRGSGGPVLGFE